MYFSIFMLENGGYALLFSRFWRNTEETFQRYKILWLKKSRNTMPFFVTDPSQYHSKNYPCIDGNLMQHILIPPLNKCHMEPLMFIACFPPILFLQLLRGETWVRNETSWLPQSFDFFFVLHQQENGEYLHTTTDEILCVLHWNFYHYFPWMETRKQKN